MSRKLHLVLLVLLFSHLSGIGQTIHHKPLAQLQQEFVDLRFGMFIHFNIPTFMNEDWADPEASPSIFNPTKLDCNQWADVAKSANMSYGCLTTKHHSGFCIWDTKSTPYNVMNSPLKRDVVKEYVQAFREKGLKVMLYYSILDTHHRIRPGFVTKQHVSMIKTQLTELLTKYGEITALVIDGWDAPWSRISYDEIPFEEIYSHVKSLQPNCLVMDLNAAKYPAEALFYTDIKSYEQGAGQHISKESNQLPALSCLPLNSSWFWKSSFPNGPLRTPSVLVNDNIVPLNNVFCNFILNVAPNREGLIDQNAMDALAEIGKLWSHTGPVATLPVADAPIISSNVAKFQKCNSSWSNDMWIMDFANDDNFTTSWNSNKAIDQPWYEVQFRKEQSFSMISIVEPQPNVSDYKLEYFVQGTWKLIPSEAKSGRVKIHRFKPVSGTAVRLTLKSFLSPPSISELGVYSEKE